LITQGRCGEIVLFDVAHQVAQGKALDLAQMAGALRSPIHVKATEDYADFRASDIVIITAGSPRKSGESREALLLKNATIVKSIVAALREYVPEAILLIVSNPLDAMTYVALKESGFPRERVIGMAGVLDSARMAHAIASVGDLPVEAINATVIGSHSDQMVPLLRFSTCKGVSVETLLDATACAEVAERTKAGGIKIVELMGTSAYYAPALSTCVMVDAILDDLKQTLPCAVLLEGEYGCREVVCGTLVTLGRHGAEQIDEVGLSNKEKNAFSASVAEVEKQIVLLKAQGLV
jgi:malate dehydrogenase